MYTNGPWSKDKPVSDRFSINPCFAGTNDFAITKLLSRIQRGLDDLAATKLWGSLDKLGKVSLLSSVGPNVFALGAHIPKRSCERVNNIHFRVMLLMRLNLFTFPDGGACCMPKVDKADGGDTELCCSPIHSRAYICTVALQAPLALGHIAVYC